MRNMTEGSEGRQIFLFSLPLMLSGFLQQAYNVVDSMIVGRVNGSSALAAIGASTSIVFLLISLLIGITNGLAVMVSQYFGAKKIDVLRRSVSTAFIFAPFASTAIGVVGALLSDPVLRLLNTPASVYGQARIYLIITFLSVPFVAIYNLAGNILRGVGDSKTPLYAVMISASLNVVLDLWFVAGLGWGVAGAAIATSISQLVSGVIEIVYVFKKMPMLRFSRADMVYDKELMGTMLRIGIPSSVQMSLMSMGFLVVQRMVNSFGDATMAAYTAANRIDGLTSMAIMNLGNAMSVFSGQNVGAGKLDRVKKGYRQAILIAMVFCVFTALLVNRYGDLLMMLFVKAEEAEVIAIGARFISIMCYFYFVFALMNISGGYLRGAGDVVFVMVSTVISLVVRVIVARYFITTPMGADGLVWAMPVGWLATALLNNLRIRSGRWQKSAVVDVDMEPQHQEPEPA